MFRMRSVTNQRSTGSSGEGSPSSSSRSPPPASSSPSMAAAAASGVTLNTSTDSNLEDDPNSSIITKVRSRVSSIIPDALSKWFSPTALKRQRESDNPGITASGRNGNLLGHRSSGYGSGQSQHDLHDDDDDDEDVGEEDQDDAPPIQKKKRFNTSLGNFNEDLIARPSGLNISAIDRRSSLPSDAQLPRGLRNTFSSSTPSTSPQQASAEGSGSGSFAYRQQQKSSLVGLANRSAAPYNFGAGGSSDPIAEEQEQHDDGESFSTSIRHRRSIREVSGRKRLNIPPMTVDRSISEPPPAPIFGGRTIFGRSNQLLSSVHQQGSNDNLIEDDLEERRQEEGDGSVALFNGNTNESASESSSVSNLNLSQSEQHAADNRRLSSFMGNNRSKRMKVGGSTGDLCFSSHLETEKSLFSTKNAGRTGRPTFNASLYGSTSSLGSNNSSLFANSPFYNGRTMYGGASAYSARRDIRQKALRVPVQMRPSSSLSNFSSSNTSLASDTSALSNTAKRILEIMNQCSGPLSEARKLGSSLSLNSTLSSSVKVPGLVQARKRFNEEDLNVNRSIRMSSPRTPYSRPQSASASVSSSSNKPPTAELMIPSVSQLLQMKRLQTNTESVRRLATESSGRTILNEPSEYKLPGSTTGAESADDSNNNVNKHTSKIRSKLHRVREESHTERSSNTPVPLVNLPEVTLGGLKSVPKFDIKLPVASSNSNNGDTASWKSVAIKTTPSLVDGGKKDSSLKNTISSSNADGSKSSSTIPGKQLPIPNNSGVFKFSAPAKVNYSGGSSVIESSNKAHNNFKFSNPEPLDSRKPTSNAVPAPKLGGFQFNPDTAKPKVTPASTSAKPISPVKAPLPLKSGSCLDALTSPIVPELKSGSCLQALSKPVQQPAGFGNAFKLTGSNKWECEACMVRNDPEKTKCVACETPKPGAKATTATAAPSFGASVSKTSTPAPDAGFKALMTQQSARWECSDCMTRNDADKVKCVCCEKAKPGAAVTTTSAAVPAAIKSMFAMPAKSASSDKGFQALVVQQSAGKWECSACMTRNEATRSKCACCEQAKPGSTPPDAPSFSFGSKPAAPASSIESTGFSFGVPKDAPKSGFTFGTASSTAAVVTTSASTGGFSFGSTSTASTDSQDKTKFSFGNSSGTATTATSTGFSFRAKPSDTTDSSKTTEEREEPKPSSGSGSTGFTFGAKPAATEPTTKSETPASSTGFSFGTLKSTPTKDSKTTGFVFGGSTSPASSTSTANAGADAKKPAATVTFGSLAATSTSSFAASTTTTASFSFGSPSTKTVAAVIGTPESKPTGSTGMFSFGTPKAVTPVTTTAGESKTPASSSTSVASSTPSVPIFGGAQKPNAPSITPGFSFGSPAGSTTTSSATTATSTATVAPSFSFGSKSTDTKPTGLGTSSSNTNTTGSSSFVFGQSGQGANKVVPTFGAIATSTASSTTAEKPVTFGSFGAASSSATAAATSSIFGGATSTGSSGFSFGGAVSSATAPAKPAEPSSSAFSFGAASNTAASSPAFGSPAAAASTVTKPMFGSPATSATPTFGRFGGSGTANSTPTFGTSTFGAAVASPASAGTGSSTSIFGQPASAPAFGSAASVGAATSGATPSTFGGVASVAQSNPFGGHQVAPTGDEPQPKKVFEFGSSSSAVNSQPSAPFQFGGNNNNNNNSDGVAKPFSFSAHSAPNFNFTAGSNAGQTSAPFTFGGGQAGIGASGMFNFGGGSLSTTAPGGLGGMAEAAPVQAPAFQFGAATAPMAQQNPFAATSIPGQSQQQMQRRKIRARRMTPR